MADELDSLIDRMMAEGQSDDDIQFVVGEWKKARQPQIRPHEPGIIEQGLSALSESGPVPAMVAGAARDIVAPVSRGVQALKSSLPRASATESGVPGAREIIDFYFGDKSRISGEYANPDEQLGAGLAQGASVLSLPSAAPALAAGTRAARTGAANVLDLAARHPGIISLGTAGVGFKTAGPVGAAVGWERGPSIAARLGEAGRRLRGPVPQPGARVVPSSGTPPALENDLLSVLDELRTPQTPPRTPEAVRVSPTSPAGGGYTIPPELPPAAPVPRPKRPPPTPPAPAAASPPQQKMLEELGRRTPVRQEPARAAQPTPEDWRGDYTSRKARERTYLGEERTLSLPELEDAYRNAVRSGDEARIAYFEKRLRQRSHITIDEIKRRVREEMKGTP